MPFEVPQINTQESIRKDVMIKTCWLLYKFLLAISAHIVLYMLLNVPVPSHESYKYPGLGKQIYMQKSQSMQSKKTLNCNQILRGKYPPSRRSFICQITTIAAAAWPKTRSWLKVYAN